MNKVQSNAEIYDRYFVPALFGQWGPIVAEAAGVGPGHRVLDVACGTGALACAAATLAGEQGSVVGLDINEEMLKVARTKPVAIDWQSGEAELLPFSDESFDAVASQFGFMFFTDQACALKEMMRVLRPGGRLAVAVCDGLDHSPGYAVFTELLHRLFGASVAEAFRAPFTCGDSGRLHEVCASAGIPDAEIVRRDGVVRFASIEALVSTERACAWTLGGLLSDEQFERLAEAAEESLRPFVAPEGDICFSMPALLVTATKN